MARKPIPKSILLLLVAAALVLAAAALKTFGSQPGQALVGYKICIDPGHGVFTQSQQEPVAPGSSQTKAAFVSGTSGAHQTEAELNLTVALQLEQALTQQGATVYLTRRGSQAERSNVERAQFANEKQVDLVIKLHADGVDDPTVSGISMQVPAAGFLTDQELLSASSQAGEAILERVIAQTGAKNRGLVPRKDLAGFNWSQVPVVLLEMGFMTNLEEEARLAQPEYQQAIVSGIVQGTIDFLTS